MYVGRRYTATFECQKVRVARCVNCDCVYAYMHSLKTRGESSSPYFLDDAGAQRRAKAEAEHNFYEYLNTEVPAACPICGWIQPAMIDEMRFKGPMAILALAACLAPIIALFVVPLDIKFLLLCMGAILFVAIYWIFYSNFDPNTKAYERIHKRDSKMPETYSLESLMARTDLPAEWANLPGAINDFERKAKRNPRAWQKNVVCSNEVMQRLEEAKRYAKIKIQVTVVLVISAILLLCIVLGK